jgi:hypothetical protein
LRARCDKVEISTGYIADENKEPAGEISRGAWSTRLCAPNSGQDWLGGEQREKNGDTNEAISSSAESNYHSLESGRVCELEHFNFSEGRMG